MPRIVAVIQARMTSTRLPGKIALPLAGVPMLARTIERVRRIAGVDETAVAAPVGRAHDPVAEIAAACGVRCMRGSEDDVLRRTREAADAAGADIVVRVTSDCPLFDPGVGTAVLRALLDGGAPYASTAMNSGFPIGFDTQVVTAQALREADAEAADPYEREHVTPFVWRRPARYPAIYLDRRPSLRAWRLAVDEEADYRLTTAVYDALYPTDPHFGLAALADLFSRRPDLLAINAGVGQKPYIGPTP